MYAHILMALGTVLLVQTAAFLWLLAAPGSSAENLSARPSRARLAAAGGEAAEQVVC